MGTKKELLFSFAIAAGITLHFSPSAFGDEVKNDCISAAQKVKQGLQLKDGSLSELNYYRDAIAQCPSMAEAHHNLGIVLFKQGKKDEAKSELSSAVELKGDAGSRLALASMAFDDGKLDTAKEQYGRILEKEPNNISALQGLGVVLERSGELPKAIEQLEKAKSLEPDNATTLYNLGLVYAKANRDEDSIVVLKKAVDADPQQAKALVFLGMQLIKLNRVDEAVPILERGVRGSSADNGDLYRVLGLAYQTRGDLEKAEVYLRKALASNAKDTAARTSLAVVLIKNKQEGLAETELNKVVSEDPKNARAYSVLGWAQIELGKYREAEINLRRSVELDPMNADAKNNLGVLYQRQGKTQTATDAYKEALSINPNLESAKNNLNKLK